MNSIGMELPPCQFDRAFDKVCMLGLKKMNVRQICNRIEKGSFIIVKTISQKRKKKSLSLLELVHTHAHRRDRVTIFHKAPQPGSVLSSHLKYLEFHHRRGRRGKSCHGYPDNNSKTSSSRAAKQPPPSQPPGQWHYRMENGGFILWK